jgi:Ca2+-binding EF-hand superfamily protein
MLAEMKITPETMMNSMDHGRTHDSVDLNELREYLQMVRPEIQIKQLEAILNHLDIDGNGLITKEELLVQIKSAKQ